MKLLLSLAPLLAGLLCGLILMLAGPPLLGFMGDHYGVLRALLVVGAVSVLALLVVPAARPLDRSDLP